jgi:hypothetical protein
MRSVTYSSRKVLKRRAYDDALPEAPSGRSIPARTGKRPKAIESGEQSLQSCLAHNGNTIPFSITLSILNPFPEILAILMMCHRRAAYAAILKME